jgi:hypothetical protein
LFAARDRVWPTRPERAELSSTGVTPCGEQRRTNRL